MNQKEKIQKGQIWIDNNNTKNPPFALYYKLTNAELVVPTNINSYRPTPEKKLKRGSKYDAFLTFEGDALTPDNLVRLFVTLNPRRADKPFEFVKVT